MALVQAVTIMANDGKGAAVEEHLRDLVRVASGESGVVTYEASQSHDQPGSFLIYEVYRDADALAEHRNNPEIQRLVGSLRDAATLAVARYKVIDGG